MEGSRLSRPRHCGVVGVQPVLYSAVVFYDINTNCPAGAVGTAARTQCTYSSCSYGGNLAVVCCAEKVRLIAITSDTAPIKPSAGVAPLYTSDELLYYRVFDGVLSLRRIESEEGESAYRLLLCSSSDTSPMLVNIVNSFSVQTLNKPANQNIGSLHVVMVAGRGAGGRSCGFYVGAMVPVCLYV